MGKRFRLITNRQKIIRLRVDRLAEAYKNSTMAGASEGERKKEARRVVHQGAKHVRPLCNVCLQKVHVVTIDRGRKTVEKIGIPRFDLIGHWCDNCLHFFYTTPPLSREKCEHKRRRVTIDRSKKIAMESGISRFCQIGYWCDDCRRFDQTKRRRVVIKKLMKEED